MSTALYRSALAAAAHDLEALGPHASARPTPGGWLVKGHKTGPGPTIRFTIPAMDDGAFPGASAGHRLIERGWIIHSAAHHADDRTASGWHDHGDGFHTAPITRTG